MEEISALMQHYQDWSCLPPASATKQDWRPLRTLLVKYQTPSRRDATAREEETKTNIYFTLMLLYYYCFFYPSLLSPTLLQSLILYLISCLQNPTISGTTSQINIKLPSFATRQWLQTTHDGPQHFNTSLSPHWHITILCKTDSHTHFSAIISRTFV